MNSQNNISSILISEQAVQEILPSILLDAIVLDEDFVIVAASQNVLDYLEFTIDDLKHQPINYLAGNKDLRSILESGLSAGYFQEKKTHMFSKSKKWVAVSITGFYLGLISDLNGSIILKIKNLDELDLINKQLLQKKAELDDFIYRTSHDLRGPLATIRGLINLIKMKKNDDDVDSLISMLAERTDKLDDRLLQLLYLAHSDREVQTPKNIVDFKSIKEKITKIANDSAVPDFTKLRYSAPDGLLYGLNEILIDSLVSNLLMHVLSLPMSRLDSQVSVNLSLEYNSLKIKIGAMGFIVNEKLREAICGSEFIYRDIVNFPQLINYYTAQKIASGLKTSIFFNSIADDKIRLSVRIPLPKGIIGGSLLTPLEREMYS